MKKFWRIAALFAALLLGVMAWFAVFLSSHSEGELRLARELSSGRLLARVAPPIPPLKVFLFGPANLSAKYLRPGLNDSGAVPQSVIFVGGPTNGATEVWYVNLDPQDKTWELEVRETRQVFLKLGGKSWRVGTKSRIWRTKRVRLDDPKSGAFKAAQDISPILAAIHSACSKASRRTLPIN